MGLETAIAALQGEDLESLESMSNSELQSYLKAVGLGSLGAAEGRAVIKSMKANASPMTQVNNFRAPVSAATFTLNISRKTKTIAAALPVPVFGPLDRESNYVEIISQSLPAGTVLTSIGKSATGKGLTFTYTSGVNVDTIDVECEQVPYVNLLRAAQGSLLKLSQNKMSISDVAFQSQFAKKVQISVNTIFGKNTDDSFIPNEFKSDLQNQNDIRIITAVTDLDQETSLVFNVINEVIGISYTSFVQRFETSRAKGF